MAPIRPLSASLWAPGATCPSGQGVTVVVDFGTLGGGVQVRCVTEPVSSGFDALTKAGFAYTGTQRFPGLLCRIDDKPADDPCVNAPPANRYWAYWIASEPGGTWTYSDTGAGTRTPPPGSVEGWAFSDGCVRTPGSGPCPSPPTTRPPATTSTAPPPPTAPGVGSAGSPAPTTQVGPGSLQAEEQEEAVGPTTTTVVDGATGSTSTTLQDEGERLDDRAPQPGERGDDEVVASADSAATARGGGGGSPLGALVGVGVVVALAAAGAITARHRRAGDGAGG